AFRTKLSLIDGEIVPWLKSNNVVVFDQEIHTALYGAIGTMRRNDLVDLAVAAPAAVRLVMEMRSDLLNDLMEMLDFAHFNSTFSAVATSSVREPVKTFSALSGRPAYASPRMIRLQRGQ